MTTAAPQYKKKDFVSDQEVRWCPGCGDYAILNGVQQVFAELGVPKENLVVVSGIGCSSRFPYYVDTFGFHTIHGRAPAVATGVKLANPELDVWVVTGDGDALSIGGNHLIHAARRNVDMVVLLFNNRIYGLTKGQYSPTTPPGKVTPSSPFGSVDAPFHPLTLALGAGAGFVARTVDTQIKHLREVVRAAHDHPGFALVEILQNCVIFNDGAFADYTGKEIRDDRQVDLRPGQPLVFGKEHDKGLRFTPHSIEVVAADEADVWDPADPNATKAFRLALCDEPHELPLPIGVFRAVERPCLAREVHEQARRVTEQLGAGTLQSLLDSGDRWEVA